MTTKKRENIFKAMALFFILGTTALAGVVYGQEKLPYRDPTEIATIQYKRNDSIVKSVPMIAWMGNVDSVESTLPPAVYHWRIITPDSIVSNWELYLTIPVESDEEIMGRDTSALITKDEYQDEYEEF